MLFAFLKKNIVNVAMRIEEALYNISMYLYNKNILEYAQIVVTHPNSMILDIEGHSKIDVYCQVSRHQTVFSFLLFPEYII